MILTGMVTSLRVGILLTVALCGYWSWQFLNLALVENQHWIEQLDQSKIVSIEKALFERARAADLIRFDSATGNISYPSGDLALQQALTLDADTWPDARKNKLLLASLHTTASGRRIRAAIRNWNAQGGMIALRDDREVMGRQNDDDSRLSDGVSITGDRPSNWRVDLTNIDRLVDYIVSPNAPAPRQFGRLSRHSRSAATTLHFADWLTLRVASRETLTLNTEIPISNPRNLYIDLVGKLVSIRVGKRTWSFSQIPPSCNTTAAICFRLAPGAIKTTPGQ
ncbi:MAG: hypothetical protein O7E57_05515, partial [Gammaproteobacteria bacterium]|nr:hypothetical protein [Gammaproteobacteria bacterium]